MLFQIERTSETHDAEPTPGCTRHVQKHENGSEYVWWSKEFATLEDLLSIGERVVIRKVWDFQDVVMKAAGIEWCIEFYDDLRE